MRAEQSRWQADSYLKTVEFTVKLVNDRIVALLELIAEGLREIGVVEV